MKAATPQNEESPGRDNAATRTAAAVNAWLVRREYRPLWHLAAVIIISGFALLLFYQHLHSSGSLIFADQAFPLTVNRIAGQVTNTWLQYGGFQIISFIEMGPWTLAYVVLAKVFGLSQPQYLLVMFTSTFALAGVSMYALSYSTISEVKQVSGSKIGVFSGSLLAAIVYMYNPWSLFHLWPFMMYTAYALLPVIFILLRKLYKRPTPFLLVGFVLLISLCSSHPTPISWIWITIAAYTVFYLIVKRFARRDLKRAAKVFFGTLGLYLLVNAAWTVPYAAAKATGIPLGPNYAPFLDQSALTSLSQSCTLSNNMRLISGYGQFGIPGSTTGFNLLLSYALPVLAVACLLFLGKKLKNNATFLFWSLLSVVLLLFATGSSFIIRRFFNYLVLRAPGAATFGWIFRSPNRMLFAVPIFYGLALGFMVAWLLRSTSRGGPDEGEQIGGDNGALSDEASLWGLEGTESRLARENLELKKRLGSYETMLSTYKQWGSVVLVVAVFIVVLLSLYPRGLYYAQNIFDSTKIPNDYQTINEYVTKTDADARIMWVPFISLDHMVYSWAPNKRVPPVNVYSGNPCLDDLQELYNNDSYFIFLSGLLQQGQWSSVQLMKKDITLSNDVAAKLFIPFAAKYMIFDSSIEGFAFNNYFDRDTSVTKMFQTPLLKVYQTNSHTPLIRAVHTTVKADSFFDNLAISQRFPPESLGQIAFVDKKPMTPSYVSVSKKFGLVDINDYKEYARINSDFEWSGPSPAQVPSWHPAPENPPGVEVTRVLKPGGATPEQLRSTMEKKPPSVGNHSLKVVNPNTAYPQIAWVHGENLLVRQGDIFSFSVSIKYRNASWSSAGIEGHEDKTGEWVQLIQCPTIQSGTKGWRSYSCSFYVPTGIDAIRPSLGGGWSNDPSKGPSVTWFDDARVSRIENDFYAKVFASGSAPKVTFKKVSAEKYKVHVTNATEPFVLVFGEAFDPFWVAKLPGGTKVQPAPLYSTINGFQIDQKGTYDLTIEYPPQSWYYLGLLISVPVVLFCLGFLIYHALGDRRKHAARASGRVFDTSKKAALSARRYLGERTDY